MRFNILVVAQRTAGAAGGAREGTPPRDSTNLRSPPYEARTSPDLETIFALSDGDGLVVLTWYAFVYLIIRSLTDAPVVAVRAQG
jgi:hypothetical protein